MAKTFSTSLSKQSSLKLRSSLGNYGLKHAPFTTTSRTRDARAARTPSLADIGSDNAATFNARQKEWRDRLAEAKQKADSQSPIFSSSPVAPNAPGSSSDDLLAHRFNVSKEEVGSLSSIAAEEHRQAARDKTDLSSTGEDGSKRKGTFSSLLYGTEEAKQMDQEIERSFSQVLARGKYVHSITFHEVKPDCVDEYVELVGEMYPRTANDPNNKVNLVGSWRTEIGDCDTFGTF